MDVDGVLFNRKRKDSGRKDTRSDSELPSSMGWHLAGLRDVSYDHL